MGSAGKKPLVYVLDPYHPAAIELLKADTSVDVILPPEASKDDALPRATGILLRSDTRINAADLEGANSKLKFIVKQGVGVDNVDLQAAKSRNVGVFNTPGLNSESVAEMTLTLALCVARRVTEFDRKIRDGEKVVRSQMLGKSLFRKSLGIVGMGAIGSELAKKWKGAMNGPLIAFDPYAKEEAWHDLFGLEGFTRVQNLNDLLKAVDVVSLHVPLTTSTTNLIGEKELAIMKDDAILLNCARGGVVDEAALLKALQAGKLFGAGLDAMQHEPPSRARYGETLLTHPRVVLTPHVGASTEENQAMSGRRAAEILLDLIAGRGEHQSLA
ncbi:phosphoglycerate dehydrogenase [Cyphellophora europaea CBS 101466]|uniref:Phosphoglycerate dehydrogenase n=1 Tax=Cyphellophora europaea (strain CBS 101466) TaxID=1220924 RepID=W2SA04_CYPE1|nr:phosphoglycerate dehydrogenase [Cyphellophora europaea CBS 101466]ETN45455.1 phosphoglycerate dehydrogenase [Cyphellophora europaea CBS 101466]